MRREVATLAAVGAMATGIAWLHCGNPVPGPGDLGFRREVARAAGWSSDRCTSLEAWLQPGICEVADPANDRESMIALAAAVERSARTEEGKVLADRAFFFVATGTPEQAREPLERACDKDRSAALLSELAALHFLYWRSEVSEKDLERALALAAEAERQPDRPPSAVAVLASMLEELGLRHEPGRLWAELKAEPEWEALATEALERLSQPTLAEKWPQAQQELEAALAGERWRTALEIAERYPLETRRWIVDVEIPEWAQKTPGSVAEKRSFEALLLLGRQRVEITGDDALLVSVEAASKLDFEKRRSLIEGLAALREGVDSLGEGTELGYRNGAGRIAIAVRKIPTEVAPLHAEALLMRQMSRMQEGCGGASAGDCQQKIRRQIEHLLAEGIDGSWKALCARAHRLLGVLPVRDAAFGSALLHHRLARDLNQELGEPENLAGMRGLIAEALQQLGQLEASWGELVWALRDMPRTGTAFRRHASLYWVTDYLRVAGHPAAALLFAREFAQAAKEDGDPVSEVEAALLLARCLLEENRLKEASEALANGRAARGARLLEEPDGRLATKVRLAEITVASHSQNAETLEQALRAVEPLRRLLRGRNERFDLRQLLADEALLWVGLGADAGVTVEEQLTELIRQWFDLLEDEERLGLLGRDREVFELMARQRWRAGDRKGAWAEVERGRGAALVKRRNAADTLGALLEPAAVQAALSPNELLIQFAVWPEEVVVWAVGRETWRSRSITVDREALANQVDTLRAAIIDERGDRAREQGELLFGYLFGDLLADLPVSAQLLLSPDGPLHRLPWAALRDSGRQEYLFQTATLSIVPSAHLLLDAERGALTFDPATPILFIANPALRGEEATAFRDLRGSSELYNVVRDLYPNAEFRTGEQANRAALAEASRFRILHFDVHGLYSPSPATSSLVLAPNDKTAGADYLLADQIAKLDLSGVDLVILAGCDTARGFERGAGELDGLVRAFLAAGTRAVIGSQWKVKDRAAVELFETMYQELAAGAPAAQAFARSQAKLSSKEVSGFSSWLAFQVIAGD